MIPKKSAGDFNNIENYRPLSLTSSISKLVERIVGDHLTNHLISKNVLIPNQSGFRIGRSTHDNLTYLTQKVNESFSKNCKSCGIFFDISKAFDRVWHNGLILKLVNLKICPIILKWIVDFLKQRYGQVVIDGHCSERIKIETGIPQGSVLGPLLFLIYINDIPLSNNKNPLSYSLLFADDFFSGFQFYNTGKLEGIENIIYAFLREL